FFILFFLLVFFSSRRRHTRSTRDWSSDVCSSDLAGAALRDSDVSRGAAFGDIDNDGDIDVIIANNSGPVRLLVNEVGQRNHWVRSEERRVGKECRCRWEGGQKG